MNDTTFERVKEQVDIRDYAEVHLERARRGNKYVCPACNSGGRGKPDSDSAFSITADGKHWSCFSCNQKGGDIFDLCGIVEHIADKKGQLETVAAWARIDVDSQDAQPGREEQPKPDYSQGRAAEEQRVKAAQKRLQEEIAVGNKEPLEYILRRGFTPDEMARFGFGYVQTTRADKNGWQDENGAWVNGGRILLPWRGSSYYHIDRAIGEGVSSRKYVKPDNDKVGAQPVENPDALKQNSVFIVEGMLDAYALAAMGYNSIALGGTAYETTLDYAKAQGYTGLLILMLDGDEAGRAAQEKAKEHALKLGLRVYSADLTAKTGVKDVCDGFAWARDATAEKLEEIAAAAQGEQPADGDGATDVSDTAEIAAAIYRCDGYEEPTATGLYQLDMVTNGGLRSGLTVIGATSSAGKTTLCVQLGDTIAANGRPVLFVSIEQSGRELVSKSLSRLMAQHGFKSVPAWAMNSPKERERWTEEKAAALVEALEEYTSKVAPNLFYLSASEQPTVAQVEAEAQKIRGKFGVSPVVIVDYLQLLAPKDERDTDKRAADYNVSQLRRMARDMKAPVIAISSLNRTSYSGSIEMESYKESGGIEYAADLLLGLQPYNMEERMSGAKGEDARKKKAKDITKEFKRQNVRRCEIVVLKNRNGALPPEPLPVTFDCASNLFIDGLEVTESGTGNGAEMPVI